MKLRIVIVSFFLGLLSACQKRMETASRPEDALAGPEAALPLLPDTVQFLIFMDEAKLSKERLYQRLKRDSLDLNAASEAILKETEGQGLKGIDIEKLRRRLSSGAQQTARWWLWSFEADASLDSVKPTLFVGAELGRSAIDDMMTSFSEKADSEDVTEAKVQNFREWKIYSKGDWSAVELSKEFWFFGEDEAVWAVLERVSLKSEKGSKYLKYKGIFEHGFSFAFLPSLWKTMKGAEATKDFTWLRNVVSATAWFDVGPGIQFKTALEYADPQTAQVASSELSNVLSTPQPGALELTWGIHRIMQDLVVRPNVNQVEISAAWDEASSSWALGKLSGAASSALTALYLFGKFFSNFLK